MSHSNLHETVPPKVQLPDEPYVDPQLAPLSRIEGAGPPRKVNLQQLPTWLRFFGYGLIAFLLIEMLFGLYGSVTH